MPSVYPSALPSYPTLVDGGDYILAAHQNSKAEDIVAIATELGTDPAGTAVDVKTRLARSLSGIGNLDFATSVELTIASGVTVPTQNWHTIDTQADAASDDLDTLTATNVTDGFVLFLRANNDARTVIVKHNTGNILCTGGVDIILDEQRDLVITIYDATLNKWIAFGSAAEVTASNAITLTNKRITKRVAITTDDPTAVIDCDNLDEYYLTAIVNNTEISITGTPTAGQLLFIGLKDAGTSKTLTWTGITALGTANALPVATIANKQHIIGVKRIGSTWYAIAVGVE
jgi:hypothetical protein